MTLRGRRTKRLLLTHQHGLPIHRSTANGKHVDAAAAAATTRSPYLAVALALLAVAAVGGAAFWYWIVPHARTIDYSRNLLTPERLKHHCEDHVGQPRVEEVRSLTHHTTPQACADIAHTALTPSLIRCSQQVAPGVFVALAYDLANTILIQTEEGHVVVDVAMNPERAGRIRRDLEAVAGKAPIHSIIYTHSHVVST